MQPVTVRQIVRAVQELEQVRVLLMHILCF